MSSKQKIAKLVAVLFALATEVVAQTTAPPPAPAADAKADAVARRAIETIAGPAWGKIRYLSFTFNSVYAGNVASSFPQRLDRYTGMYRVSGRDRNAVPYEAIIDVRTKKGRVWREGQEVQSEELVGVAFNRFLSDTYWLLMPLKALDAGVKREYIGDRTDSCGTTWDVVKLTFPPGAGLTAAGDEAWMWVNRDTGLVDEWDVKLPGSGQNDPPLRIYFHDYRRVGDLLISTRREIRDKNSEARFDDLVVSSDVPKGAFDK